MSDNIYVVGFAFNSELTDVVLIKKNRPAWQAGKLNGVGGKAHLGEMAMFAMSREFKEETGVYVAPVKWECFATLESCVPSPDQTRPLHNIINFFRTELSDLRIVETMTDESVQTCTISCLFENHETIPDLRWLIPMALRK
jgi:8-oxo-dGTP diphosphatase